MENLDKNLISKSNYVSPTQLLLNYFDNVGGRVEYNNLFLALDMVVNSLNKENIRTNVFFRGCRSDGNIRGVTISNELWYWVSNGFIKEVHEGDEDVDDEFKKNIFFLEFTDKAKILLSHDIIEEILKKTISSTVSIISKK